MTLENAPDEQREESEEEVALPQQEEFYRPPARFGSVPVEKEPLGWTRGQGFLKHYPRVDLPTQIIERVSLGKTEPHEPDRLIWGDNLHVMRQLPSNSIDLIYIDPPFFSGRQYNVMWGDDNEMRSFNDIWEGGMPGYLMWLNARLFEMKRLLKPAGSIYVHCDWHASHYIKVEMDKIFGFENFRNEIIWTYGRSARGAKAIANQFARNHDIILLYSKSKQYTFNRANVVERYPVGQLPSHIRVDETGAFKTSPRGDYTDDSVRRLEAEGRIHRTTSGNIRIKYPLEMKEGFVLEPKLVGSSWTDIPDMMHAPRKDRIGYPTQKPEALVERVLMASSNQGDVVADFFVGGGTTATVAQRMNRRFIVGDQSRVAVAVSAERLKQQAMTRSTEEGPTHDFTLEHWGIYEAQRLSQMPPDQFRDFVLRCYGGRQRPGESADGPIHGWRARHPIWVGSSSLASQAAPTDVRDFANAIRRTPEYQDANLRDGTMLAWGFSPQAREAAEQLRSLGELDVNFVQFSQIEIGSLDFRRHVMGQSTDKADYSEFLTFIQPPVVEVAYRANGGRAVTFDAGDSVVMNTGAEIINVQWDFNYDGQRFAATPGYSFTRDRNKKPQLQVTHKFSRTGEVMVACRIQDSKGGESTWTGRVKVQ